MLSAERFTPPRKRRLQRRKPLKPLRRPRNPPRHQIDTKRLQKHWNERLAAEGLEEIDRTDEKGDVVIASSASNAYRGLNPDECNAKLEFFLQCSSMCQQYKFKRPIDRLIMELFCEGKAKEEIRDELIKLGITYDRRSIYTIVTKHLIIFGLHGK